MARDEDVTGDASRASWLENLTLQNKMLLALGVLLLLFIASTVGALAALSRGRDVRALTDHSYQVILEFEQLAASVRDQQAGVRGFLVTPEQRFIDLYRGGEKAFAIHLDRIRMMTVDDPQQKVRVPDLGEMMARWRTQFGEPLLTLGADPAGRDQALALAIEGNHQHILEDLLQRAGRMEALERELLNGHVADLSEVDQESRWYFIGLMVLGLFGGVLSMLIASRLITEPLHRLTALMARLADHDYSVRVPELGRADEIGGIARALQQFKSLAMQSYDLNWINAHIADVSEHLQIPDGLKDFAEILTAEVSPLLKAGVAVFYQYVEETQTLEFCGGYGLRPAPEAPRSFRLGEGIAGQAAKEGKPIQVSSAPAQYLRIESTLGGASPSVILAVPVLIQNRLLGVIEFGAFEAFNDVQRRLIDELVPMIALSLENLSRRLRGEQMLQESQAQSDRLRGSEEKLREQASQLRETNEALEEKSSRLVEQKAELLGLQRETQEKADELARASQYKSDFLANMSHELRTPLNSLLILSRGLSENQSSHLDKDEVEAAKIIHESGSNLLRLINDILDLSKVEAGKMEVLFEDMKLSAFVASLRRNYAHIAKEKQLAFDVVLADGLPDVIRTDVTRLEQIAGNLLSNAFKFTAEGGVHVTIDRPPGRMDLPRGLAARECVMLFVRDSGIGIPTDKFSKIFQSFEQVDASTSRRFGGTGLGLSISRGMARLLGGEIFVDSEPMRGTTFMVLLPEHARGVVAAPRTRDLPAPPPGAREPAPAVPEPAGMHSDIAKSAPWLPALPTAPRPEAPLLPGLADPPLALPAPFVADDRANIEAGDTIILVVEDDPVFQKILGEMIRRKGFKVLAAGDGEAGFALARAFRPIGILLDVMLPGIDGWGVMDRLKAHAATRHIPVHFISAVDEHTKGLDMGAVGFLTKPVTKEGINAAFERMLHFAPDATRRVLIVDGDAEARVALRELVDHANIEFLEADAAETALQILRDTEIDCIVLDLNVPGSDGFDFLDRAAILGHVPPVVIRSGRQLEREENQRLRRHSDSLVVKGARTTERLLDEVSLFLHSVRGPVHQEPTSRSFDPSLSGRTALVVDDDMRSIFALSKTLRSRGLRALMAQDGQKALKQLADNADTDIVLLDIMMPGMDGFETLREIRAQPRFKDLPVIALTAKAMPGDREDCLAAGATDYLSKPVDIDRLLGAIKRLLH